MNDLKEQIKRSRNFILMNLDCGESHLNNFVELIRKQAAEEIFRKEPDELIENARLKADLAMAYAEIEILKNEKLKNENILKRMAKESEELLKNTDELVKISENRMKEIEELKKELEFWKLASQTNDVSARLIQKELKESSAKTAELLDNERSPVIGECPNCKRKERGLIRHHMIPRNNGGRYLTNNRILLCSLCERFLHSFFGNKYLKNKLNTEKKILGNNDFKLFGNFVFETKIKGEQASNMREVIKRFNEWKKLKKKYSGEKR